MIDEMTMGEVDDLMRYWEITPPTNVSIAKVSSILEQMFCEPNSTSKKPVTGAAATKGGDLGDLLAMFPGGQIQVGG